MSGTNFTVTSPVKEIISVLEAIQENSNFFLKPTSSTMKSGYNRFAITSKSEETGKMSQCGTVEVYGKGSNKTEMKFSGAVGDTLSEPGADQIFTRFFYILMQHLIQRGIKKF